MKNVNDDSPVEHYHSSGLALLILGAVMMLMALYYLMIEPTNSEYDHVSNFLLGLVVSLTGWWMRSHTEEDIDE